jgi:hypothetical protein
MQALRQVTRQAWRASASQLRTYKDLPVHSSPYVEAWYNAREDMEMTAKITGPMLASGFLWGCLIPYVVYEAIVTELRDSEKCSGKSIMYCPQPVEAEPARGAPPAEDEE